MADALDREEAHQHDDDQRTERDRDGQQQRQVEERDRIEPHWRVIALREGDEHRRDEEVDHRGALRERLPPSAHDDARLRQRSCMKNVEIEIAEERADGRGHRGREEHDHRGQKDQRQQVAQQSEREERRGLLDLGHGREEPPEEREVAVQKRGKERRHDRGARDGRRVEGAEFGERDAEGPHGVD